MRSAELVRVAQPIARCGEVGGISRRGLQTLGLGDIHAAVFSLPVVKRRLRVAVLACEIGGLRACLMLPQHANNLVFRKPGSLDLSVLEKAEL